MKVLVVTIITTITAPTVPGLVLLKRVKMANPTAFLPFVLHPKELVPVQVNTIIITIILHHLKTHLALVSITTTIITTIMKMKIESTQTYHKVEKLIVVRHIKNAKIVEFIGSF